MKVTDARVLEESDCCYLHFDLHFPQISQAAFSIGATAALDLEAERHYGVQCRW